MFDLDFIGNFTQSVAIGYSFIVPIGIAVAVIVICAVMHVLTK